MLSSDMHNIKKKNEIELIVMKTMIFVSRNVFDGISGRLNTKAEKN